MRIKSTRQKEVKLRVYLSMHDHLSFYLSSCAHDFITLKESYLTTLSEEFLKKADLATVWLSSLILADFGG